MIVPFWWSLQQNQIGLIKWLQWYRLIATFRSSKPSGKLAHWNLVCIEERWHSLLQKQNHHQSHFLSPYCSYLNIMTHQLGGTQGMRRPCSLVEAEEDSLSQSHQRQCKEVCEAVWCLPKVQVWEYSPYWTATTCAVPDQVWEEISMDFVEGLPRSLGKSTILVIVDRLTKFAHTHTHSLSQVSSCLLHRQHLHAIWPAKGDCIWQG